MSDKSAEWKFVAKRPIRAVDLAILLHNVIVASQDSEVGFEDPNDTVRTFVAKVNREFEVELGLLESALWACNLLNEKDKFWHPEGTGFRTFVQNLLPKERFNTRYNIVEEKIKNV